MSSEYAAYIIGGYNTLDIIAEFQNYKWRQVGSLKRGRRNHGSIIVGEQTMIIGGLDPSIDGVNMNDYPMETEVWVFREVIIRSEFDRVRNGARCPAPCFTTTDCPDNSRV